MCGDVMSELEINKKIAELKGLKIYEGCDVLLSSLNAIPLEAYRHSTGMDILNWAENITDAWELFEEMPMSQVLKQKDEIYYCNHDVRQSDLFGIGMTAPLAICNTWIKWKDSQQDEGDGV